MKLITKAIEKAAPAIYATDGQPATDKKIVAKFFTPDASWTWYMIEYDPSTETAFGWCDGGMGMPELGYFSIAELRTARGPMGLAVERDKWYPVKRYTLADVQARAALAT